MQLTSVRLSGWSIKFWHRRHPPQIQSHLPSSTPTSMQDTRINLPSPRNPGWTARALPAMRVLPVSGFLRHHYQCPHRVQGQLLGHLESLLKSTILIRAAVMHCIEMQTPLDMQMAIAIAEHIAERSMFFGVPWRDTPGRQCHLLTDGCPSGRLDGRYKSISFPSRGNTSPTQSLNTGMALVPHLLAHPQRLNHPLEPQSCRSFRPPQVVNSPPPTWRVGQALRSLASRSRSTGRNATARRQFPKERERAVRLASSADYASKPRPAKRDREKIPLPKRRLENGGDFCRLQLA